MTGAREGGPQTLPGSAPDLFCDLGPFPSLRPALVYNGDYAHSVDRMEDESVTEGAWHMSAL